MADVKPDVSNEQMSLRVKDAVSDCELTAPRCVRLLELVSCTRGTRACPCGSGALEARWTDVMSCHRPRGMEARMRGSVGDGGRSVGRFSADIHVGGRIPIAVHARDATVWIARCLQPPVA